METGDFIKKVALRKSADDRGKSLDPQNYAVRGYSPAREADIKALPVYPLYKQPVQNPTTGAFYFMLGYDGLGEAPLG